MPAWRQNSVCSYKFEKSSGKFIYRYKKSKKTLKKYITGTRVSIRVQRFMHKKQQTFEFYLYSLPLKSHKKGLKLSMF